MPVAVPLDAKPPGDGSPMNGSQDSDDRIRDIVDAASRRYWRAWCRRATILLWWDDRAFLPEDLVAEALRATLNARPNLARVGQVNAYVRRAMQSISRDWLVKHLRLPVENALDAEESALDPRDPAPRPDRQTFQHERAEHLLNLLDQRARREEVDAFFLHEVDGLKTPDIAKRMGVVPSTVRRWIRKVRRLLRDNLAEWG